MSDIEELLDRSARSVDTTPSSHTVDADLRRGQAALAHRRRRRIRYVLAVPAAVIIGTTVVSGTLGRSDDTIALGNGSHVTSGANEVPSIRLVAYHGEQLEGFTVDRIPDGWYLQGSNAFALTIAPDGDTS
jgi:hypothetical protein